MRAYHLTAYEYLILSPPSSQHQEYVFEHFLLYWLLIEVFLLRSLADLRFQRELKFIQMQKYLQETFLQNHLGLPVLLLDFERLRQPEA